MFIEGLIKNVHVWAVLELWSTLLPMLCQLHLLSFLPLSGPAGESVNETQMLYHWNTAI